MRLVTVPVVLWVLWVVLLWGCAGPTHAKTHEFSLEGVSSYLMVNNFGYRAGGSILLDLSGLRYDRNMTVSESAGFILYKDLDDGTFLVLEEGNDIGCLMTSLTPSGDDVSFSLPPSLGQDQSLHFSQSIESSGLYTLVYYTCTESKITGKAISRNLNPSGNHLSVGEDLFPMIYWIFSFVFAAMTAVWIVLLVKERAMTFKIHILMGILVGLKTAALFFDALRYEHIRSSGSSEGFAVAYYLFAIPKGTILFVVILLVGAGWSFLSPALSRRDRRILMVVIPIQVLVNVALAVVEERVQTYSKLMMWRDILRIIDFACCVAVLVPVVMTIRSLNSEAQESGQTLRSVEKLRKFRSFYLLTIIFLYFTRVVVILLGSALGYQHAWITLFLTELSAVLFYGWCGKEFRPRHENPYMSFEDIEEDELEMGPMSTQMEFEDDSETPSGRRQ